MAVSDLYVHSADGRVEAFWVGGAVLGTLEYALDSGGLSGWTVASAVIVGANNHYAHTLTNSTTARWWRYTEAGTTITFADPAYANSGKFKDADGWYVVPLAAGKVCRFYSSATATPAGSDANDGLGIATPKLNYSSGAQTGGDHQLFKRGETFSTGGVLLGTNGPSSTSLSVIGAYGPSSVARPILSASAGNNVIIVDLTNTRSHFAILHVDMRFTTRDGDNATCLYWLDGGTGATDGLISGCRGFQGDMGFVFNGIGSNITGLICHRCVATDCYSVGGEGVADSSGFFAAYCSSPVFEDCYSLDCGYLASNRATYKNTTRNHAFYLSEHSLNYTFRNCVALGNDSQIRGGGLYERLLGINCPVGFNTAATNNNSGTFVAEDALVQDCWFDGSSDISGSVGEDRGWGARLGANDQTAIGLITVKNTGFNLSSGSGGITTGTNIQPVNYDRQAGSNAGNVTLDGILVVDSEPIDEAYGLVHIEHAPVTFRMVRSVLDVPTSSPILSHLNATPTNWQFGSNRYYSPTVDGTTYNNTWFYNQDTISGRTVAQWASYVSDPYSGFSASTKEAGHVTFTAKRRITDYCTQVGLAATVAAWKAACDGQRFGAWLAAYTAENAIDWIRQGYGMPALLGPALVDRSCLAWHPKARHSVALRRLATALTRLGRSGSARCLVKTFKKSLQSSLARL
jgi:hypothetical protein